MTISAITARELKDHFKKYTDKVTDYNDALIVTRPKNKNVVIISEKEFNSIQETNYLLSNEANRKNLMESIQQAEKGEVKLLTPEEFNELTDEA